MIRHNTNMSKWWQLDSNTAAMLRQNSIKDDGIVLLIPVHIFVHIPQTQPPLYNVQSINNVYQQSIFGYRSCVSILLIKILLC